MSFLFPSSTITFDAALRDLAKGSPRARAFAAHALGDVSEPTEKRRAVEALIGALEDDRFEVRAEACGSLGELGEAAAVPALIKRLADGHAPVRQNAAIALGSIKHADGFEPLVECLRDGSPDLRFQAATSLAEIDGKRAFDLMIPTLADADPQVVGAAALALGAIPGTLEDDPAARDFATRAKTALVEHLHHTDAGARFDVAYALAELGDSAGRNELSRGLTNEERAWDAVTALANLGGKDDLAVLANALTDRGVPAEATVLAAGSLLRAAPDHAPARRVLLAGLEHKKGHVRGLAIEQLTELGGDWATQPLEKMAKLGKNGDMLEAIAGALDAIAERSKP